MAVMFDSDIPSGIPAGATIVAGYVLGGDYDDLVARFPNALHVSIATRARDGGQWVQARVLDIETGDALPTDAPGWVEAMRGFGIDPCVYVDLSSWAEVQRFVADAGVAQPDYWIADWTSSGPHLVPGSVATQWWDFGEFDESETNGVWPGLSTPVVGPPPAPIEIMKPTEGECGVLNAPVVAVVPNPTGQGYTLVGADGGVFNYNSVFLGSLANVKLNAPIVDAVGTKTGKGIYMVATDGGVFCFGDAQFYGSAGSIKLNEPVVSIGLTDTGNGYWLTAADGGIFNYGDAEFLGSPA
jgi:hypothetical protein